MNVGDQAYINLYKGYNLLSKLNKKVSPRRAGLFRILAKYRNAYRIAIPKSQKIYPIISIKYLEPKPPGEDPYYRPIANGTTGPDLQEGDNEEW